MTRPSPEDIDAEALPGLLEHLKRARGFDFSGYKRPSLERRIRRRMTEVGVDSYRDYQDHLEVTPSEFTDLFNTILINVTGFFRDKPSWEHLAEQVIPQLVEERDDDRPIRVWSAACASGEEAYTLAMVLAEVMGEDAFRRRVKIYATDVDEQALALARSGVYSSDDVKAVPPELRDKYFEPHHSGFVVRNDMRRTVIFGRNDLVQDAPISRVDLLVCRNVLMYFTAETQAHVLSHFNFALTDAGFLFLGRSEMLITHGELFTPHNLRFRLFRKVPQHVPAPPAGLRPQRRRAPARTASATQSCGTAPATSARSRTSRSTAAGSSPRSTVPRGCSSRSRQTDVGKPLQDLEVSYRPADLRTALLRVYAEAEPIHLGRYVWDEHDGAPTALDIDVVPILGAADLVIGASLLFADVTDFAELGEKHERQKRQLEGAHEELQSTVEELETTNEELQSTNEELETTNEELQSSNEELETMNEELRSTNDELEVMNEDQRERSGELDRANLFLEGILGNLGIGVVVLDPDLNVQVWNAASQELWGLRADEVEGQSLLALDFGLPVGELAEPLSRVQRNPPERIEVTLPAVNRRGRSMDCLVRLSPLAGADGRRFGILVLMSHTEQGRDAEEISAG